MYGKISGASSTGVGAVILPNTGSNRPLFYAALTLLLIGMVTLAISSYMTFKSNKSEAK